MTETENIEELRAELEKLKKENLEREIAIEKAKKEEVLKLEENKKQELLRAEIREELIKEMGAKSTVKEPEKLEKPQHEMATFYAKIKERKNLTGLSYEQQCERLKEECVMR